MSSSNSTSASDQRALRWTGVIVFIIREEFPPTLFFFSEELGGHWVSQSTCLVAPSRGLQGYRGVGSPHLRIFL